MKILFYLLSNQNLKRYIKYLDDDPLNKTKADITDDLISSGSIILTPYDINILTDAKVKIFFYPNRGINYDNVQGIDRYICDIIVPLQYWILKGQGKTRPYSIAYEIAQMIDGKDIGIGEANIPDNWFLHPVNENFAGLCMYIDIKNAIRR